MGAPVSGCRRWEVWRSSVFLDYVVFIGCRRGHREVVVADTDAEALELARNAGCFIWTTFFEPFGFNAALMRPGEDPATIPNTFESMVERGLTIAGSPDTVSRAFEKLLEE